MLNYIWAFMIIGSIIYGSISGNIGEVGNAAVDSSKEAVELCITMVGVMSMWMGMMEIARTSGIIRRCEQALEPFIDYMFDNVDRNNSARPHIATNIIANVLGLGWAATPAGLMAMNELGKQNKGNEASNDMCTFLVLNISSLQLIPVNIIAYRSQYGSVNAAGITGFAILATLASTITAIIYCKLKRKFRES